MIVKNEEKTLPTCLKSIKNHVDEIVIVDTGSTDGTLSIAESFGARVYHHPWENHFSKHRNQSLSYAQGEWHFIIDADEELQAENVDDLRQALLPADDMDAIAVVVECPFGENGARACHNSIRLIRNHRGIFYKGRVHNYLVGAKRVLCAPVHILHHGYVSDRETQVKRFERTTALLRKDIEEDPENPRPHHFLAASFLSEHMNSEAAREAEKAISLRQKSPLEIHTYLWSLYIASSAYLEMGELEKAHALAKMGVDTHPDHLDSHYNLAVISYHTGDAEAFRMHRARYLEIRGLIERNSSRFGEMVHNTFASAWLIHLFGCCLSMKQNETGMAEEELEKAKALCPDSYAFHSTFGKLLARLGNYQKALEELTIALEMFPHETQVMWTLSYVCEKLGKTTEQIQWLQTIIALDPAFPNAQFQAGLAFMRMGNYKAAEELFRKTYSLDPNNHLARINDALCLRGMGMYEQSLMLALEVEPKSQEESCTLLLNMACCHDVLGQDEHAIESFVKLEQEWHDSLEAPVYLSRLFLRKGEIERMVAECDHLLKLLNLDRNTTLQSLADLGALYSIAGERLVSPLGKTDLSTICSEISRFLGYSAKAPACP